MSKITLSRKSLAIASFLAYFALVAMAAAAYGGISTKISDGVFPKATIIVFGPALALFTHMSVFLFAPLSVPLLAFCLISALYPQTRLAMAMAFAATWLSFGWFLHDLF